MATMYNGIDEKERERLRRLAQMRAGIEEKNEADKAMQAAAGEAAEGQPVSQEWNDLNKLDEAVDAGTFRQNAGNGQEEPAALPEIKAEPDQAAPALNEQEETQGQAIAEETKDEAESDEEAEEEALNGEETEEGQETTETEEKTGFEYNGQVYGDGELDLSHDPGEAVAVMHSGGMNALTEETIQAMDAWTEESDGIRAVLGILTDENMQEYAEIGENGELFEKNNRNAHSIFISNCCVLGPTLSKFAMKLNDPNFPPSLYGKAAGTVLTIVEMADANGEGYEEYIRNNMDSEEVAALTSAFGFCDDLFTEENGLDVVMQAAVKETQQRCCKGEGTDEDFALLEVQVPDLTDDEKAQDAKYTELMTRYGQEDKNSYELGNENSWLNLQTAQNLKENGYEVDLTGIEAMSFKDIMLGCRQEAADMVAEYAHKLGYSSMGEFMEENGFTEEMIDELALHNFRVFEKTFATPENAQTVESLTASDDEERPVTEANLIEAACRGFGAGVVGYLSEGFEAFYTWTQSTNIPTDSARVRNKYTEKYGFFGGEKVLCNELKEMCESGFFPNDNMNTFVRNYLEEGGNPYLLGIIPGELGWVAETANGLSDMKEVNDEWSEGLSGINQVVYGFSSRAGEKAAGMIAENRLIKPLLGYMGLKKSADVLTPLFSSGSGWYNAGYDRGMEKGLGNGEANMYSMMYSICAWIGNAESVSSDTMKAGCSIMLDALKREDVSQFIVGMGKLYKMLPQDVKEGINTGQKSASSMIGVYITDEKENAIGRGAGWVTDNLYGDPNKTDVMTPSDELEAVARFFVIH